MNPYPSLLSARFGFLVACICSLLLAGCLAQQAELVQVERDLSAKIAKLDKQEKELDRAIKQAKADIEKMVSETRARLNQDITVLRDADLPSMRGGIERSMHQVAVLRQRVEDIEHQIAKRLSGIEKTQDEQAAAARGERERLQEELGKLTTRLDAMNASVTATMGTMAKTLGARLEEHDKALGAVEARLAEVGQVESQNRALADQMAQYGKAIADFKKALSALGDKLVQEEQRLSELAKLSGRTDALAVKVETDAKATGAYLNDVNKSIASLKKALETVGGQMMTRVEDQERRLNEMAKSFQAVDAQFNTLAQSIHHLRDAQQAIEANAKTTSTHLNELNKGMASLKKALETVGGQMMTRVEDQERRLNETAKVLQAVDAQISALIQTVTQLREAQEAMARGATHPGGGGLEGQNGQKKVSLDTAPFPPREGGGQIPPRQEANVREAAREAYERILQKYKQGDVDGAMQGFSEFLIRFPSSELAPNSQYWLGECLYAKREYERAIEAFERVKLLYPASEKVPAALLKKGFAHLALKDRQRASLVWKQVVDEYPKSREAEKAMEKLAQLKQIR